MTIPQLSFCERWFGCACNCSCNDEEEPPTPNTVQKIPRPGTPSHADGIEAANKFNKKMREKRHQKLASTDMTTLDSVMKMTEEQYRKYVSDRSPNQQPNSAPTELQPTSRVHKEDP